MGSAVSPTGNTGRRMVAVIVVVGVLAVSVVVAFVLGRRTQVDAPTQPAQYGVPVQLDRADFTRPSAPWLVVVFTSSTCDACASAVDKTTVLASDDVAVQEVEYGAHRALHDRYDIEAVPMVLVADADGVVRASFLGVPSAADLWAAVAAVRDE